jgi:hypothetical protein
MERYIYYSGQRDWTMDDFDYLNSYLNKLFKYRDKEENRERIKHMNLSAMEDTTKAILKAVLLTQNILEEITSNYKNLEKIKNVEPLKEPLYLQEEPCNLFDEYKKLNIII